MINFSRSALRKMSAFTCMLLAIGMLLAGLFVSAPAQAAEPVSVTVDVANSTVTYKHTYDDLVLFVVTDARGDRNVTVPSGNVGFTETFTPDWGTSFSAKYLNPVTLLFVPAGNYPLPEPVAPVTGTLVSTNYSISCETGQPVATWTLTTTSDGPTNIRVRAQDGISIPAVLYIPQTSYPINGVNTKGFTFPVTESTLMFFVFSDAIDDGGRIIKTDMLYNETFTVPACVTEPIPTPIQSATVTVDPATGNTVINLATVGAGTGSYQIIVNGDLTRPAVNVAAGSTQQIPLTGLQPGTSIQVRVYGDGSGNGFLLATQEVPERPDDTATKMIDLCHATSNRAESYELIKVSVKALLEEHGHGGHHMDIFGPFTDVSKGETINHPGNRWDEEGKAIFNNECAIKLTPSPTETATSSPTTPTKTETATPSPTTTATSTATSSPSPTATATTTPSETAKATPSESMTSEAAVVTTSKNPGSYVDTAAPSSSGPSLASLFYAGAVAFLLLAFLLFRTVVLEERRH